MKEIIMKAFILSDLHLEPKFLTEAFYIEKLKRRFSIQAMNVLKESDIVIISGDVVENGIIRSSENPLDALYKIFKKEVIFCLGNHEFAYQKHSDVIKYWSQWKHPNVHCLDVEGNVLYNNVNFVGNVLWYDFTLNKNQFLMKGEILDGWLDKTIEDFDPLKECEKCKKQIIENCSKDHKNVLVTHMVPHVDLNTFSKEQPQSPYNAYSGCDRFLLDVQDQGYDIEYAICGHTHRRECKEIWNIKCVNIGNDYYFRSGMISYMSIDIN